MGTWRCRGLFGRQSTPVGTVLNFTTTTSDGFSPISFQVIDTSDGLLSVTVTIQDAVILNGTMMTCNNEKTVIGVLLPRKIWGPLIALSMIARLSVVMCTNYCDSAGH